VQAGLTRVNLDEVDEAEQKAIAAMQTALAGKVVGVQVATIHANFAEQTLGDGVTLRRYDTQENLVLDLQSGRIDAGLADAVAWQPFLDSAEGKQAGYVGPGFNGGVFGQGIGIAVRKGEPALLDALNAALASMKADGSLKELAEKWFGFDSSLP